MPTAEEKIELEHPDGSIIVVPLEAQERLSAVFDLTKQQETKIIELEQKISDLQSGEEITALTLENNDLKKKIESLQSGEKSQIIKDHIIKAKENMDKLLEEVINL